MNSLARFAAFAVTSVILLSPLSAHAGVALSYATITAGGVGTDVLGLDGNDTCGFIYTGGPFNGYVSINGVYHAVNYPGAYSTSLQHISNGVAIGIYENDSTNLHYHTFKWVNGVVTTIDPPNSVSSNTVGISGNNIIGNYQDTGNAYHSYLFNGTSYTLLSFGGSTAPSLAAISGSNVAGNYFDSGFNPHGFIYSGGTYTAVDYPGATQTQLTGISGTTVTGYYSGNDGIAHGFSFDGANYVSFDPPGAQRTSPDAIDGHNIVGHFTDSNNVVRGFFFDGTNFTVFDPPGAAGDDIPSAISGSKIIGNYTDYTGHAGAYLATFVPGVSFSNWQTTSFTPSQQANPNFIAAGATPFHDGIPNLLKYAYGIDPSVPLTAAARAMLPVTTLSPDQSTLTITYHRYLALDGPVLTPQVSSTLQTADWQPAVAVSQTGTDANGNLIMQAQVDVSTNPQFLRLQIAAP
jgi:hypothetical protein